MAATYSATVTRRARARAALGLDGPGSGRRETDTVRAYTDALVRLWGLAGSNHRKPWAAIAEMAVDRGGVGYAVATDRHLTWCPTAADAHDVYLGHGGPVIVVRLGLLVDSS